MIISKKNIGPFLAFNKSWFGQHQKKLVWLLNAPLIKYWFRWVLRIRRYDCGINEKIVRIEPNCYTVFLKKSKRKIYLRTDFRTHWKFSKRIYCAFKPLWWLIHFWDYLIADRFYPKLSFGFLTLTAFPDPGSPGTASVDGFVRRLGTQITWADVHDNAGTASDATDVNLYMQLARNGTSNWDGVIRGVTLFDTSSLGSSADISAVTLSLFGKSKDTAIAWVLNIDGPNTSATTTLTSSDYNVGNWVGSKYATGITGANFSTTAYNDFTLNTTGRARVSKTGISKFGHRAEDDIDNIEPGGTAGQQGTANSASADTAGTANDPKLVVTYTTGGAGNLMLMGVS